MTTDCEGTEQKKCSGSKVFHPPETDDNPNADQDGDGDFDFLTIVVTNGDRDGDGCCDFEESWRGIDNPNIGCCYCDVLEEWWKAGGYYLTDRIDSQLHAGRLLFPGDRGSVGTSSTGGSSMPAMVERLYWELDFLSPLAPAGVTFPVVKLWIPLTAENFVTMWTTNGGGSHLVWDPLLTQWNAFRSYLRLAGLFLVSIWCVGICLKEVRV